MRKSTLGRIFASRLPTRAPPPQRGPASTQRHKIRTMDIERINAIGNQIADLSERTTALRGYL